MADIRVGQSLEDWYWRVLGGGAGCCMDGYFTTKGGKLLDSGVPAEQLGLRPAGGGFSGGEKGSRGGGGNSVQAGDWTCGNCCQPGSWNTRYSCYQCGAPRYLDQENGGQSSSNAQGMGGRYQGGVGSGMGSLRVVGPTGRDQAYTPGGDSYAKKRAPKRWGE